MITTSSCFILVSNVFSWVFRSCLRGEGLAHRLVIKACELRFSSPVFSVHNLLNFHAKKSDTVGDSYPSSYLYEHYRSSAVVASCTRCGIAVRGVGSP